MTYFSAEQVALLLKPIHPKRVLVRDGQCYVAGYDIKAELNRVFGFGLWSTDILDQALICEAETRTKTYKDKRTGEERGGNAAWYVVYKTSLRLTVCAPDGQPVCHHEESHVGESTHPVRGEAHGNALVNSWTYALKRCATSLGDQFGLSLYGKGSMDALVRWTLVHPEADGGPATADTDDVPQVTPEEGAGEPVPDDADEVNQIAAEQQARDKGSSPPPANGGRELDRPVTGNGTITRPAPRKAPASPAEADIDKGAQPFADEAHEARTLPVLTDIRRRVVAARKLSAYVRNPATGGIGGLGQLMEFKRRQLAEAEAALKELDAAAAAAGLAKAELEETVQGLEGTGIEGATPAQLRSAAEAIAKAAHTMPAAAEMVSGG